MQTQKTYWIEIQFSGIHAMTYKNINLDIGLPIHIPLDYHTWRSRCNKLNMVHAFEIPSFKRDYDTAFGKIVAILSWYGVIENPRNLRYRFTLCMQEFFDSIPQDQWDIKDPAFIKQSEMFAITKFKEWIIEQIT